MYHPVYTSAQLTMSAEAAGFFLWLLPPGGAADLSLQCQCGAELARWGAAGITGGFAGGERGLQQLVEKGEIKLAEPGKSAHPTHPTLPLCFLTYLGALRLSGLPAKVG